MTAIETEMDATPEDDAPPGDDAQLLAILARWHAFSELQQRVFSFLAAETVATGQEFENSTDGATSILTRIAFDAGARPADADLRAETGEVVRRLQSADRSRQILEQVAGVLSALQHQQAHLMRDTLALAHAATAMPQDAFDDWIDALTAPVSLADWRHRLEDALLGRPPRAELAHADTDDIELF